MLKQRKVKNWAEPVNALLFLVLVMLILGVFFRFVNLDKKPYWHDETYTSLRISGYTKAQLIQQSEQGVFGIKDLLKYQYPNPEKNVINVVNSLAAEDTHPPFHVLITRFWMQWFGNSPAVARNLSAVISLLALPCIYYLCLELFNSPLTGWMAICLLAVSPFHVLYAQEARPYSLLGTTILLSSTFLLRAMRLNTKRSWYLYAVTLTLGFYSHLFFGLAAVGYGIYAIAVEKFRLTKKLSNYLLATCLGLLAFTPWILTVALNFSSFKSASSWISTQKLTLLGAIRIWFENISLSFVDLQVANYFHISKFSLYFLLIPILLLVGYAIYFLYVTTSKRTYLFVFTLIGVTALALIAADIILGGNRQTWPRYIVACYLGIELAVAHLLATKITAVSVSLQRQKLWQIVVVALISCGVLSCAVSSQAESWWNNYGGAFHLQASRVINLTPQPLLLGDRSAFMGAMPLVYLLDPKVKFQYIGSSLPQISSNVSDVFLFYPSEKLKTELKNQNYKLELLSKDNSSPLELWKVNYDANVS